MSKPDSQIFQNYWSRKQALEGQVPRFAIRQWHRTEALCEIEKVYFEEIKNKKSVLDVGAGDLRLKNKFQAAGFVGEYHSQDVSDEHSHTYKCLSEVNRKYEAILCFDVIEHLSLHNGLELILKMKSLLADNGVLILQTPNARCVRNPLAWDMTHLHCYNLPDLWAFVTAEGFQVAGYRVVFSSGEGTLNTVKELISRFIITRILGCDYADNIALVAHRNRV